MFKLVAQSPGDWSEDQEEIGDDQLELINTVNNLDTK